MPTTTYPPTSQVSLTWAQDIEIRALFEGLLAGDPAARAAEEAAAGVDAVAGLGAQLALPMMALHTVIRQAACSIPGVVGRGRGFYSAFAMAPAGLQAGRRTAVNLTGGLEVRAWGTGGRVLGCWRAGVLGHIGADAAAGKALRCFLQGAPVQSNLPSRVCL